jgi:beta-glucosidase
MKGRTYRYFGGDVQYPFGFGLSYTSFAYAWQKQPAQLISQALTLDFSINIKNTGTMDGDEVAQVYIKYPPVDRMPLEELKAFKRVHITKTAGQTIRFSIPVAELEKWDLQQKKWVLYPGDYHIMIGSSSRDIKLDSVINIKTDSQ